MYIFTKYNKIFHGVFDLQSRHKINGLSLPNITKGDNANSKKGRVVIFVRDKLSGPVLHCTFLPSTIKIFQRVFVLQSENKIYIKQNKGRYRDQNLHLSVRIYK